MLELLGKYSYEMYMQKGYTGGDLHREYKTVLGKGSYEIYIQKRYTRGDLHRGYKIVLRVHIKCTYKRLGFFN